MNKNALDNLYFVRVFCMFLKTTYSFYIYGNREFLMAIAYKWTKRKVLIQVSMPVRIKLNQVFYIGVKLLNDQKRIGKKRKIKCMHEN